LQLTRKIHFKNFGSKNLIVSTLLKGLNELAQ